MKQKFCILLLMFSLLTIVPPVITAKASNLTIDVKTVTQKGKKPYIEYQINRPSFHNFSDSKFQNKLNLYYKNPLTNLKQIRKRSKKYYKETADLVHPFIRT